MRFTLLDCCFELVPTEAAYGCGETALALAAVDTAAQGLDYVLSKCLALIVRARMKQRDPARQVVEYQQGLGRDISGLRESFIRRVVVGQALEVTHDVITCRADEAAGKRDTLDYRVELRASR